MITEKREQERVEIRTTQSGQLRTDDLLRKIKSMENTVDVQKAYIERLEQKLKELEQSRRQMIDERIKQTTEAKKATFKDKELVLREQMIAGLRHQLAASETERENARLVFNRKTELEQLIEEQKVPLVPVKTWSKEALAEADKLYGLQDRMAWIEDFRESNTAQKYCVALSIKGVIGKLDEKTAERLRQAGIIVVTGMEPNRGEWWAWVNKKELENALRSGERGSLLGWLGSHRKREEG